MASRYYTQFLYSLLPNKDLVFLEGSFRIGATGAVAPTTASVGAGSQNVTKVGTGSYVLQLQDNYSRFVGFDALVFPPTSAAGFTQDGSLTIGTAYQIIFASTSTNWYTLGLPLGLTPTAGQGFVATSGASNGPSGSSGVTAAGNGTVIPVLNTNITGFQVLANPNVSLRSSTAGSYITFQTMGTSAFIPTNPTSGTVIRYNIMMRNSNLLGKGETSTNY